MKASLGYFQTLSFLSLLLLCSCSTENSIRPSLPADVTFNREVGRGDHLSVKVRLEGGKELPFDVDTGSPITVLNTSLEPQLGKRISQSSLNWWDGKEKSSVYAAPKLYLGNTRLPMGGIVFTSDLKRMGSLKMGILGMDCLRHYCIQLDFTAGKMRFLDSRNLNTAELGKAYPITFSNADAHGRFIHPVIRHDGLVAGNTNLVIDTGCNIDGLVSVDAIKGSAVFLPECVWDGDTYTNLIVAAAGHMNVLGLNFLARHLVTFDFPNRMLYLKQTSTGPLAGDILNEISHSNHRAMLEAYLSSRHQLPGLPKDDQGPVYLEADSGSNSVTFGIHSSDGSFAFHYEFNRAAADTPWKIKKAWRTDKNGAKVEEFTVP